MNVPREVIFRHAFKRAAEYFAEKIEGERRGGKVAILIKDFYESIYFMPCDERGYPNKHYFKTLEIPRLQMSLVEDDIPSSSDITIFSTEIMVDKPLLSFSDYFDGYQPIVFMWSGRKMGREQVPVEKLNVQELMRIAQAAIKNREGLVIDEALKNKIYK